ncbi:MAG: hypothetical protein IID17_06955 [Nitrospinae bacterium]|nr:hypothetical protein [Nitrospinota bacterium]
MGNQISRCCKECGTQVDHLPTLVEYEGQEIFLFDPVICKNCLLNLCDTFSVKCENCGGSIPPYSQVGVLKADNGQRQFVHMNITCSTVGSAFYGYWGKGNLHHFIEIEAC